MGLHGNQLNSTPLEHKMRFKRPLTNKIMRRILANSIRRLWVGLPLPQHIDRQTQPDFSHFFPENLQNCPALASHRPLKSLNPARITRAGRR